MSRMHALLLALALTLATPFVCADGPPININTANAAELARELVGVGPAKAEAIIAHREKFGPFTDIDELRYVKGIGASTVERNRARLTVGDVDAEQAQASR